MGGVSLAISRQPDGPAGQSDESTFNDGPSGDVLRRIQEYRVVLLAIMIHRCRRGQLSTADVRLCGLACSTNNGVTRVVSRRSESLVAGDAIYVPRVRYNDILGVEVRVRLVAERRSYQGEHGRHHPVRRMGRQRVEVNAMMANPHHRYCSNLSVLTRRTSPR